MPEYKPDYARAQATARELLTVWLTDADQVPKTRNAIADAILEARALQAEEDAAFLESHVQLIRSGLVTESSGNMVDTLKHRARQLREQKIGSSEKKAHT